MIEETKKPRVRVWLRATYYVWLVVLYAVCLVALGGVAAGFAAFVVYDHATRPGYNGDLVTVTIPEGATGAKVGEILADAGLLEYPWMFRAAMYIDERRPVDPERAGGQINFGKYTIPKGNSATEILYRMYEGPSGSMRADDVLRVTIPEGLSIPQIAGQLEVNGQDGEGFLEAVTDTAFVATVGFDTPSLEGFLMPNTYFFDTKPDGHAIAQRMLGQFKTEYDRIKQDFPEVVERNIVEILTVASLVEEEARLDDERAIVASVIYNRLDRGMPLQMDSTLQFALNKYGQRMLNADKEVDSPYNTYKYAGLPPGPISNPGVASIRAALSPAETKFLYFVSNADGQSHTFSETLDEHNRAVARFNRDIAIQRREQRESQ